MAAGYDGTVRINTKLDTKDFNAGVNQVQKSVSGLMSSFSGLLKTLGVGLSIAGIAKLGKEAIEIASDLQEVQNVVDTAFKDMSYKMEEFADTCIEQFGISKLSAKEMGSTFMAMASNMVPSMEQASDMAIALTGRAADMASFYNKTASETAIALKAVFTGETEVLKSYGVVMTEANLQQYAYQKGMNKQLSAMTQAEKVQLRYNYVMDQTSLAMGDFAKTSDSWANQTRILSEQFKELLGILGNGLITVLTPVIKTLNTVLSQLIAIANAIGTTMSKILGLKSSTISASSGTGAIADDIAQAAESTDDLSNGIKSAGKEASKSLAPFDELNNLTSSASNSGSSSGASIGNIEIDTQVAEAEKLEDTNTLFDGLIKRLQEIENLFKKGFLNGIRNLKPKLTELENIIDSIKDHVLEMFADGSIAEAFNGMIDNIAYALGSVTGSFADIGATIALNLLGGIDQWLDNDSDYIKKKLISIFDLTGESALIAAQFFDVFAYIFSAFGEENGQRLTGSILGMFSTVSLSLTELCLKIGNDAASALLKPFSDNQDGIKRCLDNLLGLFADFGEDINEILQYSFDGINTLYDEHISPFFESIGEGLSTLVDSLISVWDEYIYPVFIELSELLGVTIEEYVKPAIDSVLEFLGKLCDALMLLWNSVLVPLLDWLIKNILPKVKPIIKELGNLLDTFVRTVSLLIQDIMDILGGLIDFLVGVFTVDWQKAWDGLVSIVKGCINIIIDCINGMLRALFNGINHVVDLINGLLGKLPQTILTTVGFSALPHFEAPQIPRLATGTVVPRGVSEFLAILGDNKKETEVVSPLSTIEEAVNRAIDSRNIGGNSDNEEVIILQVDGDELFRWVRKKNREYKETTGESAFA